MRRRDLLAGGVAAATAHVFRPLLASPPSADQPAVGPRAPLPVRIAGMTLAELRDDYRARLFEQYLPFWDKGGIDREHGGFRCELEEDGSVAADEKYIWYQGRGLWVYSFLHAEFGRDPRWIQIARPARDFMVRHMGLSGGRWVQKVRSDGTPIEGLGPNVYGWLFAALGLAEYARATGRDEDLELAAESVAAAMAAYDDPGYTDTHTTQYTGLDVNPRGLRSQGHSMVLVGILGGSSALRAHRRLAGLCERHVELLMERFWNPEYRIVNEYLRHDYSRAPGADAHMLAGHSVEALWMAMADALRRGDRTTFNTGTGRVRRLLEMCWDPIFDGWADGNYHVFGSGKSARGPDYDVKTMWAQCEAMVACMMIAEHTGAPWAFEWYERLRAYALRVMPVPGHGVWRQAVDRRGRDLKRTGVSAHRKDNFHQARYLMLNLLSLERMLAGAA